MNFLMQNNIFIKEFFVNKISRFCCMLCFLFYSTNAKAGDYFTTPLKDKGVHFILEAGLGYSHYSSPGRLYKNNQTVYHVLGILGYDMKSMFLGIGGTASRHVKDHMYSFRSFLTTRYKFKNIPMNPYGEIIGGVVGYLKWNDFVKPYYALGAGIYILPRLSIGLRVAKVGTLDNQNATEWSANVSFKF